MGSYDADVDNETGGLESEFRDSLEGISSLLGISPQRLIQYIELESGPGGLISAIRVFVLNHFRGSELPRVWFH